MTCYSVQPRDQIFFCYGFLSFTKNIIKNIEKSVSNNISNKYIQAPLYHAKKSAADAINAASEKSNSKNFGSNW